MSESECKSDDVGVLLAPIALFVYNRPLHVQQTVEALQKNVEAMGSDLFVFSDAAKSPVEEAGVHQVREYIHTIRGFRSIKIIEQESNVGLAGSIINGVTLVLETHGRVIVVEDDLVTAPFFLQYMNEALEKYALEDRIASVHGYVYPIETPLPETFFLRGADCWGWGTWSRAWRHFEPDGRKLASALRERKIVKAFDLGGAYPYYRMLINQISGKNNSWAIRWHASAFLAGMLTLYPCRSLVRNIGLGGVGTHCKGGAWMAGQLVDRPIVIQNVEVVESRVACQAVSEYLRAQRWPLWKGRLGQFFGWKT